MRNKKLFFKISFYFVAIFALNWLVEEAKATTLFLPRTITIENPSSGKLVVADLQAKPDGVVEGENPSATPMEIIRTVALEMNFTEVDKLIRLAECESTFNPACGELNNPECINPKNMSYDRGYFQISRRWHPEISDNCSFDLKCAAAASIDIINERGFEEWACGKNEM